MPIFVFENGSRGGPVAKMKKYFHLLESMYEVAH